MLRKTAVILSSLLSVIVSLTASGTGKPADADSVSVSTFSFDKILMSMDAVYLPPQETDSAEMVSSTLDYMAHLFDRGPGSELILGGDLSALSRTHIPDGDIPFNVSQFVMPATGTVTSPFGYRKNFGRFHRGVDIDICRGDTIRAAFPGTVTLTRNDARGYGYYIIITHPNGLQTLYGHLDSFLVVPSAKVEAGDPIAIGGSTGNSSGPHLHFETRYHAAAIDPAAIVDLRSGHPYSATFLFNKERHLGTGKRDKKALAGSVSKPRQTARK